MLKDKVLIVLHRQTITLYRLHFQKWRLGIAFKQSSDCAINVPLNVLVANRARLAWATNGPEIDELDAWTSCTRAGLTTADHRTLFHHTKRTVHRRYLTLLMFIAPLLVTPITRTQVLLAIHRLARLPTAIFHSLSRTMEIRGLWRWVPETTRQSCIIFRSSRAR